MLVLLWLLVCSFGGGVGEGCLFLFILWWIIRSEPRALAVCGTSPLTYILNIQLLKCERFNNVTVGGQIPVCLDSSSLLQSWDGEALCLPSTLSLQIRFSSGLVLVGGGKQFMLLKYLWLNFCSSVDGCTDIKATVFIICAQFYYSLCNIQFDKTHKITVRIHTDLCSL